MALLLQQMLVVWKFAGLVWFLWVPVGLFFILRTTWLHYVHGRTLSEQKCILLEIIVPKDVAKSPKAMESIFAGLYGAFKKADIVEKYRDGYLNPWHSLEIVGDVRGVHFYFWTQEGFRQMIESHIYAQYPSSEVLVVEDYTKFLPKDLPNEDYSMWGAEMTLTKPDAYPIRTYEDFVLEDISTKEEERKIDPLAALVEFFGTLKDGEHIWMQLLVRPTEDDWKKEGEALIAEMVGREARKKLTVVGRILNLVGDFLGLIFVASAAGGEAQKEAAPLLFRLTPGQQETIKAVERNITKIGFDVGLRWLYIARKDIYNGLAIPTILGMFKQFSSMSLNGFKLNGKTKTTAGYIFKRHMAKRKPRLFQAYRLRSFFYPPFNKFKPFVLSSSELATIYHFPGTVVGAPAMSRIEAKKSTPPINLPI